MKTSSSVAMSEADVLSCDSIRICFFKKWNTEGSHWIHGLLSFLIEGYANTTFVVPAEIFIVNVEPFDKFNTDDCKPLIFPVVNPELLRP